MTGKTYEGSFGDTDNILFLDSGVGYPGLFRL